MAKHSYERARWNRREARRRSKINGWPWWSPRICNHKDHEDWRDEVTFGQLRLSRSVNGGVSEASSKYRKLWRRQAHIICRLHRLEAHDEADNRVTMPFAFETLQPEDVPKLYHDPIMLSYYEFLYDLAKDQGYAGNCYSRQLFVIMARTEAAFRQRQNQWVSALKTGETRYGTTHWAKEPPFTNSTGRITGELALLEKGKSGLMLGFYYNASAGKGYIATCALV